MRRAILTLFCVLSVLGLVAFAQSTGESRPFTFFVIGDPQTNVERFGTAGTEMTIEWMNTLPGKDFPFGGKVDTPRGVFVLGDMVDDLRNPENWKTYKTLFDPLGNARLRFPAFECIGNHDLEGKSHDGMLSYVQQAFTERNLQREGKFRVDGRAYHYSWDWEQVHFVMLNIFPGNTPRPVYNRPSPWNDPQSSLDFLKSDLKEQVGTSGRPVVLLWHYGLRGWGREMWWDPEDLANLKKAIEPYNIALIIHGHEHAYARYEWEGYDVMMAPSPQYDRDPKKLETFSRPKGFVVFRISGDKLESAEYTAKGWEEKWSKSLRLAK